jgi:cyclase
MKKKSKTWKVILIIGILLLVVIAAGAIYLYPSYRFFFQEETVAIDKTLSLYKGGGGNSGILVTAQAIVVIDTKMGSSAENLYNQAKNKAGSLPILVINTHYHGDHVKGNHFYTGSKIYTGNYDRSFLQSEVGADDQPTDLVKDSLCLDLGDETVCMYDMGQAHTYHDMIVYLKNHKVLFSGDLIFNNVNPVLMQKSSADVDKWIGVLNKIISRFPDATYIPGHGPVGGKEIALSLLHYFEDMRAAAADPSREKETIEKYKDWTELPMMASPSKTIEYIRQSHENQK